MYSAWSCVCFFCEWSYCPRKFIDFTGHYKFKYSLSCFLFAELIHRSQASHVNSLNAIYELNSKLKSW